MFVGTILGAEQRSVEQELGGQGKKRLARLLPFNFPFKASEQGLEQTASTKLKLAKLNYLVSPLENLPTPLSPQLL